MWGPEIDVEAIVDAVGGLPEGKSAKKLLLDLRVAGDKFFGAQIYERARRGDSLTISRIGFSAIPPQIRAVKL